MTRALATVVTPHIGEESSLESQQADASGMPGLYQGIPWTRERLFVGQALASVVDTKVAEPQKPAVEPLRDWGVVTRKPRVCHEAPAMPGRHLTRGLASVRVTVVRCED